MVMSSSSPRARILFVDDLEDWRTQVGNLLKEYGYEVVCADSPEHAFQCLDRQGPFDLAIVDLRLVAQNPASGAELARGIRQRERELPIIVLSGYVGETPSHLIAELAQAPLKSAVVDKGKIETLLYQIEALIPWQKRSIYCFVSMPFSLEGVYDVIREVTNELGIQALRVDESHCAGDIPNEIRHHLRHNSFVIADLTHLNPNVMYELGFAHALGKPVIHLSQTRPLPEFVSRSRTIFYDAKYTGLENLRSELKAAIKETLETSTGMPKTTISLRSQSSYVAFIPDTELGREVRREVISPVIRRLGLEEIRVYETGSHVSVRQERWSEIERSSVVIAEISEGDPQTYYFVGASDALKGRCVLLLLKKGERPPFNLQDRAGTVKYDSSTYRGAVIAQQELEVRIRACLRRTETTEEDAETGTHISERKARLSDRVKDGWTLAAQGLDQYVHNAWTADQRAAQRDRVEQAKRRLRNLADEATRRVENAMSVAELENLDRELEAEMASWCDEAIKVLHR